jgi:hypothetical protein
MSGNTVDDVARTLQENDITTYVVARRDMESIVSFDPLTKPNGKYYDLNDKFYDILDNIAYSIAELIRI